MKLPALRSDRGIGPHLEGTGATRQRNCSRINLRQEVEALLTRAQREDAASIAVLAGEGHLRACLVLSNRAGFASQSRLVEVSRPFAPLGEDGQPGEIQRSGDGYLVRAVPLPALGMAALPVTRVEPPAPLAPSPATRLGWGAELKVKIVAAGIESLLYAGQELLQGVADVEIYRQHPEQFDAWELVPPELRVPLELHHLQPVRLEAGPLRQTVLLRHRGPEGMEVQEKIALERRERQADRFDQHQPAADERSLHLRFSPYQPIALRLSPARDEGRARL